MDIQIAQIAQQVSSLSSTQGPLPGQPETNPWGHVNVLSVVGKRLEESPMMVLQETVSVPDSTGTYEQNEEESLNSIGKVTPPPPFYPYQSPVPYPQRVAWAKLFQLEPKFVRFLDMLKRIYADTPFLEALKRAPSYIQFLRELLSRKGEQGGASVVHMGEVCSSILQSQSPSKLHDPGTFSIPYVIGDLYNKGALCELGASKSLMPLSFYRRL